MKSRLLGAAYISAAIFGTSATVTNAAILTQTQQLNYTVDRSISFPVPLGSSGIDTGASSTEYFLFQKFDSVAQGCVSVSCLTRVDVEYNLSVQDNLTGSLILSPADDFVNDWFLYTGNNMALIYADPALDFYIPSPESTVLDFVSGGPLIGKTAIANGSFSVDTEAFVLPDNVYALTDPIYVNPFLATSVDEQFKIGVDILSTIRCETGFSVTAICEVDQLLNWSGQISVTYYFEPVPIPPALYLFGSGLIGLAVMARKKTA